MSIPGIDTARFPAFQGLGGPPMGPGPAIPSFLGRPPIASTGKFPNLAGGVSMGPASVSAMMVDNRFEHHTSGRAIVTSTTLCVRNAKPMNEQFGLHMPIFIGNPVEKREFKRFPISKGMCLTLLALNAELKTNRDKYRVTNCCDYGGPARAWLLKGIQETNVNEVATLEQRVVDITINECHNAIIPNLWHPKPRGTPGIQDDYIVPGYRLWLVLSAYEYDVSKEAEDLSMTQSKKRFYTGENAIRYLGLQAKVDRPELATDDTKDFYWAWTPFATATDEKPPRELYENSKFRGSVLRIGTVQRLYKAHVNPPPNLYHIIENCLFGRVPVGDANQVMTEIPRLDVGIAI